MTTAFKENQSPRLPDNHPAHVERILARQKPRRKWSVAFINALTVLIYVFCLILIAYAL